MGPIDLCSLQPHESGTRGGCHDRGRHKKPDVGTFLRKGALYCPHYANAPAAAKAISWSTTNRRCDTKDDHGGNGNLRKSTWWLPRSWEADDRVMPDRRCAIRDSLRQHRVVISAPVYRSVWLGKGSNISFRQMSNKYYRTNTGCSDYPVWTSLSIRASSFVSG